MAVLHGNGNYIRELVKCGVKLYKEIGVKWLFVLGGGRRPPYVEEAEKIRTGLMINGVLRSHILMDVESTNTLENALAARFLTHYIGNPDPDAIGYPIAIETILESITKIAVVAASFHALRSVRTDVAWIAGRRNSNGEIEIIHRNILFFPYPYVPSEVVDKQQNLTPTGIKLVKKERSNLIKYDSLGHLVEVEGAKETGYRWKELSNPPPVP